MVVAVGGIGDTGSSFYTNSYAIAKQGSETSGLRSTNDVIEDKNLQDLTQVGKNVQIPNTMVSTQAEIGKAVGSLLDIRA